MFLWKTLISLQAIRRETVPVLLLSRLSAVRHPSWVANQMLSNVVLYDAILFLNTWDLLSKHLSSDCNACHTWRSVISGRAAFFISVFHSLLQWQSVSGVSPCTHSQMDNITNGHISILKQKWYTNHTSSLLWFRFQLLQLNCHNTRDKTEHPTVLTDMDSHILVNLQEKKITTTIITITIALLQCIFCQKYAQITLTLKYVLEYL